MTQGEYPPPHPNLGDLWINKFNQLHTWTGAFWTKVQNAAAEDSVAEDYIPKPVPVTSSNRNTSYCSEEEAAEKLSVFEQAADISGRLAVIEKAAAKNSFQLQVEYLNRKIDKVQKEMVTLTNIPKDAELARILKQYQEELYNLRLDNLFNRLDKK